MRRRDFLIGLGAAACPAVARAQKPERLRLIGMLTTSNDPEMKAFEQELEKRGWSEGRNIHIEHRYAPAGTQAEISAVPIFWIVRSNWRFGHAPNSPP